MATEMVYTQSQVDGNIRALTRTLAELRERTDEVGRLTEAVRSMQGSDAILRAQVATLEQDTVQLTVAQIAASIRVENAEEDRDAALVLVREMVTGNMEPTDWNAWMARAGVLLGDGAE